MVTGTVTRALVHIIPECNQFVTGSFGFLLSHQRVVSGGFSKFQLNRLKSINTVVLGRY